MNMYDFRRFIAYIIDSSLVYFVIFLVGLLQNLLGPFSSLSLAILYAILSISYFSLFLFYYQQTLGMKFFNFFLISKENTLTMLQVLKREVIFYLFFSVLAGFILLFFTSVSNVNISNLQTITVYQTLLSNVIALSFVLLSKLFFQTYYPHDYFAKTDVIQK